MYITLLVFFKASNILNVINFKFSLETSRELKSVFFFNPNLKWLCGILEERLKQLKSSLLCCRVIMYPLKHLN